MKTTYLFVNKSGELIFVSLGKIEYKITGCNLYETGFVGFGEINFTLKIPIKK